MTAPALWCPPPLAPRPCTRARRDVIAAACEALGAMSDDDLRDMADHDESARVRIAARFVLAGRLTAVPAHPPLPMPATTGAQR